MPGYVKAALQQFGHPTPTKRQDSPYPYTPPKYGQKVQYALKADNTPLLGEADKRFIQQVCGKFLYYGQAVDNTILVAISAIAAQQAKPTADTLAKTKHLLDYLASQEEAILTYSASNMVLAVHSDAGYLNKANARSPGQEAISSYQIIQFTPPNNGALLNVAQIIKNVMSSAAEAKLGALFICAREAVYIGQILKEMGHPQPPTPIQTDNSTAEGVVNSKIQPKRTNAMDMRFHWLRDRETLKQLRIY